MTGQDASPADDLSRRIIEFNRQARLGDTPMGIWANRVATLLAAQPDLEEPFEIVSVRPPVGGAGSSSGTLFVDIRFSGAAEPRPFVLRFVPAEQLFHVYDLDGQVRIQRGVSESGVPAPQQCWEDMKGRYLGVPGYIMERAPGEAAPGAWFAQGIIAEASPERRRELVFAFVRALAQIHAVDWRRRGLGFLLDRSSGRGLIESEVNWYRDAMLWAGEQDALARFAGIRDWLIANQPPVRRPVLCHGDANFTNYMFAGTDISAVIDWEMAFIGTPECDLSYAVAGMAALTDEFPEGVPTSEEILAEYERISGTALESMPYYRLFTLYRIVLIHFLGLRAFPSDFQSAFAAYLDSLIAKLWAAAADVGAA